MTEVLPSREQESSRIEQNAIQASESLQNLSPEQTQDANNALQETSLAQKSQEKSQEANGETSEQKLSKEFSQEKRSQLNGLVKNITKDALVRLETEFKATNTDPNSQFSVIQQRYHVLEAIAQNPDIQSQFPQFVETIQELVQIKYTPMSFDEQFAKVNQVQQKLEKCGVYLNCDFAATGGSFVMEIQGKTKPQEAVLGNLYKEENLADKLQPCTILGNEPEFNKKGYAFDGKTYLNPGAVDNAIDLQVQNGRFTEAERANMNIENINLATINHEESHRLLGEIYNFPKGYQEIPADDVANWQINGVPFQPQNYTQVDEFIAHSVGQMTDNYETIENIAQGITQLSRNENGRLEYKQNPETPDSKAYGLLRAFVMEEVANIMNEKGVTGFKESLIHKRENTPANIYNKEYNSLKNQLEQAQSENRDSEQVNALSQRFNEHDAKWDETLAQDEKVWNETTRDIIKILGQDGLQRINQKCMEQAQRYMTVIEQKFPRVQKS